MTRERGRRETDPVGVVARDLRFIRRAVEVLLLAAVVLCAAVLALMLRYLP